MRANPRSIIWLSMAATVGVLAASAWVLLQEPPPLQVQRLPDGTVLRLEAITRGPEHRLALGRRWQRLLALALPRRLLSHTGVTLCVFGPTEPTTLVFWTTWHTNLALDDWSRILAFNERGEEVEVTAGPCESWLQSGARVRGWVVATFPRRGAMVGLRFYSYRKRNPLAEFRVPNPDPGPHPDWNGTAMPTSLRKGDLECTLERFETGRVAPAAAVSLRDRIWTRAVFRFREHGQPSDRWEPVGVGLTDATGNREVRWPDWRRQYGGDMDLAIFGNLPQSETVWKLRSEFVPARRFAPTDLWTLNRIPVPSPKGESHYATHKQWRGDRLQLTISQEDGGPGFIFLFLQLATPRLEGTHVALIRAIDERGRQIRIDGWPRLGYLISSDSFPEPRLEIVPPAARTIERAWSWSERGVYSLRCSRSAKTLDFTVAVMKSYSFEFVARPTLR